MPTAIDPIDPTLILSELAQLKSGIAATVAAETELEKSRKSRTLKLAQEITRREEADAAGFSARLAELAAIHQEATLRRERRYQARKDHLPRAYHASRAALAKRLDERKIKAVGRAQGAILSDRKKLHEELAEESARHQSIMTGVLTDRAALRELKEAFLRDFRGFQPVFGPALFDGVFKAQPGTPPAGQGAGPMRGQMEAARAAIEEAPSQPIAKFFRFAPFTFLLAPLLLVLQAFGKDVPAVWLVLSGLVFIAWCAGLFLAFPVARRAAAALRAAYDASRTSEKASLALVAAKQAEIDEHERLHNEGLNQTFQETDQETKARLEEGQRELQQQLATLPDRMLDMHRKRLRALDRKHNEAAAKIRAEMEETAKIRKQARLAANGAADTVSEAGIAELAGPWESGVIARRAGLARLERESAAAFPAWNTALVEAWTPPAETPSTIRIGRIEVDLGKLPGGLPECPRLALADGTISSAPFALGFPDGGSLLIESEGGFEESVAALNAVSTRIFASLPPGRASFVFIDPVGLGRGFAGLMHLADYEDLLINHRIWTQAGQIEERLAELNEHIEKIIQMYLRNEYAAIEDYNRQAGSTAEKYRFLVIAGYPSAFSETAAKRLLSIATSGARCGVHLLIQRDMRLPAVDSSLDEALRRACLQVTFSKGEFRIGGDKVLFDPAPSDEDVSTLIHKIGRASIDSNRVEVPFSQITPPEGEMWSLDTSEELRVPIGRAGATKQQMLSLGKGTRQHALIAGKTGSGKSTLFHVIITNLALWTSPARVEFYLVDFKKGVEFKCYADRKLPHARVVAIESDRGFALSVLQRVDAELKRRGELFRKAGSQDLAGYNRSGEKPLPRTLLLIDEFQEFFTEDDTVAQQASLLLDRIVRQGRAFGIHVILGSQTLGGAYTLARATLGQMAVRIALQCNEADAHLIMDEENPAPRLLTRPGEGIYNDQSGAMAANSPFQIVWLPEKEREEILEKVAARAHAGGGEPEAPLVFEGNAPAEIRDNPELAKALHSNPRSRPAAANAWLGAPNSIKGPTAAVFKRQSGSNLLVVSQSPEQAVSMLAGSLLSLAAQYPPDQAEFVILDPQAADDSSESLLRDVAGKLPHSIRIGGPAEVAELMAALAENLEARAANSGKNAPETFLIIHDLQRFKALRPEDEFKFSYDDTPSGPTPSQTIANLLGDGGPSGMHVIASIDTWNNVSRWIPRKLLAEFEMRVLFQMSANDSSNLIDSPDASGLGLHCALFHNEHLGAMEIFRPYAPMEKEWLDGVAGTLSAAVI